MHKLAGFLACSYPKGSDSALVTITYLSGVTKADFASLVATVKKSPPFKSAVSITGLGSDAYVETLGSVNSLSVLAGTIDISISAPVKVAKLEILARAVIKRF